MQKIAIIGGGAVGTAVLHYLIDGLSKSHFNEALEIILFEKAKKIGPGLAYDSDCETNILNRSAETMSVLYDKPNDFFDWLQNNYNKYKNEFPQINIENKDNFLPRGIFGKYLEEFFESILRNAKNLNVDIKVNKIEVTDLVQVEDVYVVSTKNGSIFKFNSVVLALGNMPSVKYPNIRYSEKYFISPYPVVNLIKQIPKEASVGIIGSRLSAIDVAIGLKEHQHNGNLSFVSRSGFLPSVKTTYRNYKLKILTKEMINSLTNSGDKNLKLSTLIRLITEEVSQACGAKVKISDWFSRSSNPIEFLESELNSSSKMSAIWNDVFISINDVIEDLWQKLSMEDKLTFSKYMKNQWLSYRVGIPEHNARKILHLFKTNELQLISGMEEISHNKKKDNFLIKTLENESHYFDYIIDASGYFNYIQSIESTLIQNMYRNNIINSHHFGGIDVDFNTSRLINKNKSIQKNIYAVGNLTHGVHFFTSVLELNSKNANIVANNIINSLYS